ncbi:MAG: DNA repair protein RadC [Clostridiales bacterium]|nr:DNA repair protein RadC [Clostridiales bacterium]
MAKIKELPAAERPREKLLGQGKESLSNAELLALLIGSGTREKGASALAEELLAALDDGVSSLGTAAPEELSGLKGIGDATAARVLAAAELGMRIAFAGLDVPAACAARYGGKSVSARQPALRMMCPEDVAFPFRAKLAPELQECFYTVLLNVRGEKIGEALISRGSANSTEADPRDVFRPAVKRGASAVILVHNHPSGSPEPSEEDLRLTKRLVQAGELIGIRVLDHIIIGREGHVSLRGRRQM